MSKKESSIDNQFCRIPMGNGKYRYSEELDKINRMIVLGPGCFISTKELVTELQMLELPINIRLTCYGAHINGEEEYVLEAVKKARGFPVGDPRRCRAKRKGAREGFHQLQAEYQLLPHVSYALEHMKRVEVTRPKRVSVDEFKDVMNEVCPENSTNTE